MKHLWYSVIFILVFSCAEINDESAKYETAQMSLAKMDSQMQGAKKTFETICSSCHGEQMQAFADRKWKHGKEPDSLKKSIINGFPDLGMPPFGETMADTAIDKMVDYIILGIENVDKFKSPDFMIKNKRYQISDEELSIRNKNQLEKYYKPIGKELKRKRKLFRVCR